VILEPREYVQTAGLNELVVEFLVNEDDQRLDEHYEQSQRNGNEAYHETVPLTGTVVVIAAAQEPVEATTTKLACLRHQMDQPNIRPFNVTLSVNYPETAQTGRELENITRTQELITDFQQSSSGRRLPLSFIEVVYPEDTAIGAIRRDLDTVSMRGLHDQYHHRRLRIPEHAGLLISDIDTLKLSPAFVAEQQAELERGMYWTAGMVHFPPPGKGYPQLNRAISAINLVNRSDPFMAHDTYCMYNLRTIIAGDGHHPHDRWRETHSMRARAATLLGDQMLNSAFRPAGAIAYSSPRRLIRQLQAGKGLHSMWEPNQFGMHEDYRHKQHIGSDIQPALAGRIVVEAIFTMKTTALSSLKKALHVSYPDIPQDTINHHAEIYMERLIAVANLRLGLEAPLVGIDHHK
jgi:hypothetical protein